MISCSCSLHHGQALAEGGCAKCLEELNISRNDCQITPEGLAQFITLHPLSSLIMNDMVGLTFFPSRWRTCPYWNGSLGQGSNRVRSGMKLSTHCASIALLACGYIFCIITASRLSIHSSHSVQRLEYRGTLVSDDVLQGLFKSTPNLHSLTVHCRRLCHIAKAADNILNDTAGPVK